MADHLINIRVNLISNADEFVRDIRRQFEELDRLAGAPATPAAATARLTQTQGEALAQLQRARETGNVDQAQFNRALADVRAESARQQQRYEQQLGQQVRAPRPADVRAVSREVYGELNTGASQEQINKANAQMATALDDQVKAERATRRRMARSTQQTEAAMAKAESDRVANIDRVARETERMFEADAKSTDDVRKTRQRINRESDRTEGIFVAAEKRRQANIDRVARETERMFEADAKSTDDVRKTRQRINIVADRTEGMFAAAETKRQRNIDRVAAETERMFATDAKAQDDLRKKRQRINRVADRTEQMFEAAEQKRLARINRVADETLGMFPETQAENRGAAADARAMRDRYARQNADLVNSQAQQIIEQQGLTHAVNQRVREINRQTGADRAGATRYQRLQMWAHEKQGGAPRIGTDFLTLRQSLTSGMMRTGGYALSGAALYGGLQFGADILDEAGDLQQQLALVQSAFEETGATADGVTFDQFREELRGLSTDSGVAINQVANVTRQLAGAFADPTTGAPNFDRALREADAALKFSRITGLPQQEITDSMTAMSLAFDRSFTEIADATTYLSRSFGVVEADIVRFTADLAPLGEELGFSAEQMSALGAVAQQASGRSGTALAEQFGRILPGLQDRQVELLELFQQNAQTRDVLPDLGEAFNAGEIDQVLALLIENYGKLDDAQRNSLAALVGGRREAAAFYAVLDRGDAALRALDETSDGLGRKGLGAGEAARRWEKFSQTFQQQAAELRREIEELGIALFEAGIDDALALIVDVMKGFVQTGEVLMNIVGGINDVFGGLPGKILAAAAALKAWQLASGAIGSRLGGGGLAGAGSRLTAFLPMLNPLNPYAAGSTTALRPAAQKAALSPYLGRVMTRQGGGGMGAPVVRGVGTAFGTAAAGAAPMAAFILGGIALDRMGDYGSEVASEMEKFDAKVADAFAKGMTEEEIMEALGDIPEESDFSKIANRIFTGQAAPGEQMEQSVREHGHALRKDAQQELAKNLADDEERLGKLARSAWEAHREGRVDEIAIEYPDESRAERRRILDETERVHFEENFKEELIRAAKDYAKEGDLETEETFLTMLRSADNEQIDAALAAIEETSLQKAEDAGRLADAVKAEPGLELSTAALRRRYQRGQVGLDQYRRALERELANKRDIAAMPGLTREDRDRIEGEIAALEDEIGQAELDAINERYEGLRRRLGFRTGGTTAAQDLVIAQRTFADLTTAGAAETPMGREALAESAQTFIESQTAAWKEAIDNAGSYAEALALLQQGPGEVPQEMLDAINLDLLSTGDAATFAQYIQDTFEFDTIDQAKRFLIDMYNQYGENWYAQVMALIDAEIVQSEAALEALERVGGVPFAAQRKHHEDLIRQRAKYAATGAAIPFQGQPGTGTEGPGETDEERKAREQGARERRARFAVENARIRDDVERARRRVAQLKESRADLAPGDKAAADELEAEIIEAEYDLQDAVKARADRLADGAAALARARAGDDPMVAALLAVADARRALADAAPEDRDAALAALIEAERGVVEVQRDIDDARRGYLAAVAEASGDTVTAARYELESANAAVARAAEGTKARWDAMAQQVRAQRGVREALISAFSAQKDLAAALFESIGDTVNVARMQLDDANNRYRTLLAAGVRGEEMDAAQAAAIRAQTNLTDVQRQGRMRDWEYLYEFDRITADQFINFLQQDLAAIPETNKELRYEIERKIRALREEMSSELGWNLPTNLKLPTLYEARRLGQTPSGGYNDNKVITINLTANNAIDGQAAVQTIVDAINGPPRVGVSPRLY